ncbi:hypothetical protein KAU51_04200 [Candidatus Parcubacteria bacterium]|nr:hypothetical protein [Candidatus Parcubacteria bacterium]
MKDLSNESEATLKEMLDYLCSKIDFRKTDLDNTAVICMNTLFTKLNKQTEKYEL